MRKVLRIAASVVGALACALVLALWVRSYATFDRVSVPLRGGRTLLGAQSLVLISYQGRLTAVVVPTSIPEAWWEQGDVHPVRGRTEGGVVRPAGNESAAVGEWHYPDLLWPRKSVLGFGWIWQTMYLNIPNPPQPRERQHGGLTGRSWTAPSTGLMAPDWFVALVLGGATVLPWRRPRFSVRTMLLATTLIAVLMGIFTLASRAPLGRFPLE